MLDFPINDDEQDPLEFRRARRGELPPIAGVRRSGPDFSGMESEGPESNTFDIAGPGPQRTPAELPAIDVPAVGAASSGNSDKSGNSANSAGGAPRATIAGPGANATTATNATSATSATPRASIAGQVLDPLEIDRQKHQTELGRLRSSGSGISQIHNPFLRGLARVADIAGSSLFPFQTAMIPGTEFHHRQLMNQESGAIEQDLGEQKKQAETEHEQEQSKKIEHDLNAPEAHTPEEQAFDDLIKQGKSPMEAYQAIKTVAQKELKPGSPEEQAFQDLVKHGATPFDAFKQVQGAKQEAKPDTSAQEDQRYERIVSDHKQGKPVTAEDQAWAQAYEKRKTLAPVTTFNLAAPGKEAAGAEKSYQSQSKRLDNMGKPITDAVARLGRLQETLRQGTPQADALVAPELLTVMAGGAGSGLRMNEAEIARVIGGRSKIESLKATLQQWSTDPAKANSITPAQRQQMQALVNAVHDKLLRKQAILNDADEKLLDTDDPAEHKRIVVNAKKALSDIDEGKEAAQGGEKVLSQAAVQKAAKDHNVSYDEAKKQAESQGYTVK